MAQTNNNVPAGNTNPNNPTAAQSEISVKGKWLAGFLLIVLTAGTVITMIAHWPDRMPSPRAESAKYIYQWFAVSLYSQTDSVAVDAAGNDTEVMPRVVPYMKNEVKKPACLIDLNTLIMVLIALGGFLGNMVHIATSLTNFIGADRFRKRWIMWYCVKPFIAAALAICIYILFRAGFLNGSNSTTNINLYGVVSIAILAGLFTDRATKKLGQVFAVVFQEGATQGQPARPDLLNTAIIIESIVPAALALADGAATITITGTGFDKSSFSVKIGDTAITDIQKTATTASFNYTPTVAGEFAMVVTDSNGTELKSQQITIT